MASVKAFLGEVAGRLLFRHGEVKRVEQLSEHFVRIDVAGKELEGAPFTPGDKVQVFLDGEMRTYTPVTWEGDRTWFLGFVHGEGPGGSWVRTVKQGDAVAFFGPRGSIDVSAEKGPLVVVGDETSLGLAVSLTRANPGRQVMALLEAESPDETREVGRKLELTQLTVTERGQLLPPLVAQLELGVFPIFTGCAATIQALKQQLRAQGRSVGGKAKAYWAAAKRGLD